MTTEVPMVGTINTDKEDLSPENIKSLESDELRKKNPTYIDSSKPASKAVAPSNVGYKRPCVDFDSETAALMKKKSAVITSETEKAASDNIQADTEEGQAAALSTDSLLANTLASTHLGEEEEDRDPSAKRARVGSKDGSMRSTEKETSSILPDDEDDNWTKVSEESSIASAFDFCSSSEDEGDEDKQRSKVLLARKFDVGLMVKSVESGEAVLDQVEGRDVVLVVGKTGTGKSTLIQAIAGRSLKQTLHTCASSDGVEASQIVFDVQDGNDVLAGFEIGHGKTSRTESIHCYDSRDDSPPRRVVYVDSPGFEDTNGHEVDIATSVMLTQVAKRCKSLRFVILINYVSLVEDRGGAFRSVLKLIRSFTGDFKQDRQSFMLLFSHTNEIQGVPDSIEGARSCLKNEMIQILNGKQEEDIADITKYIHKALQKDFPFVDVFLPLKTDMPKLIGTIESSMTPVKDQTYLARNCGLSPNSRMTLSGEIQSQLDRLRRELSKDNPDADAVRGFIKIFKYFGQYIHTEDVRGKVDEAMTEVTRFIERNIACIEAELERSSCDDRDFGDANAAIVDKTLIRLAILKDDFSQQVSYDRILRHIEDAVGQLVSEIKTGSFCSFAGIHRRLDKLQSWAQTFSNFVPNYQDAIDHSHHVLMGLVADAQPLTSEEFEGLTSDQLELYLSKLSILNSVMDDTRDLPRHQLPFESAAGTCSSCIVSLQSTLCSWSAYTPHDVKNAIRGHGLQSLTARVHSLETSGKLLDFDPKLKEATAVLGNQIARDVLECYKECCSETLQSLGQSLASSSRKSFVELREFRQSFVCMRDFRYREVVAAFEALVEDAKSILKHQSGEIEEISVSAENHGVRDGARDAKMLTNFESFSWFDDFLRNEDRFMENCCVRFQYVYKKRISQVHSQTKRCIHRLQMDSEDSPSAVRELTPCLREMKQMSYLSHALQNEALASIEEDARTELLQHVEQLGRRARLTVMEWSDAAHKTNRNNFDSASSKLNYVLAESSTLLGVDDSCDKVLESLRADVHMATGDFQRRLLAQLNSGGQYELKASLLLRLSYVQEYSHVAKLLPDFDRLKQSVRNSVASDAKAIEDLVSETSEWDQVDILLTRFQDAVFLDEFTNNEASSRLRPLLQLREQKQEEVDSLLDSLIVNKDFHGIRDFILPYAKSKDQIKQTKFDQWRSKIGSSLGDAVGVINRDLGKKVSVEMSQNVAFYLKVLESARDELGPHLQDLPGGLSLGKQILSFKKKINQKLKAFLSNFEKHRKSRNFEGMGITHFYIDTLSMSLQPYASAVTKKEISSIKRKYDESKKSISTQITKFADSYFRNDTLLNILATLRSAAESVEPKLNDLERLYEATRQALTEKVNAVFATVSEWVSQHRCYCEGIEALSALNRQLINGMKDHVVVGSLSFDCEAQLREWRGEKQKMDSDMDFDGRNAEERLQMWATQLANLKSHSMFFKISRVFSRTTYHEKVREINDKVSTSFSRGAKALNDSDFSSLHECIHVLNLICLNVGAHIPKAKEKSEQLTERALDKFLATCTQAQTVLETPHRRQFAAVFSDYRGIVKQVPSVMVSKEAQKAFSLTNQLIYEAIVSDIADMEKQLDSFDFAKLKVKVQNARKFGGVLADQCTLLYEEVKTSEHVKMDRWLQKIFDICLEHFSFNRRLQHIKYFAVLGIQPSATKEEIKKAYKSLAKKFHPDKTGVADGRAFRRVKEALDCLEDNIDFDAAEERPFAPFIKNVRTSLREKVRDYIKDQRYELVEALLFRLKDLKALDKLVTPFLDHRETENEIRQLVRDHVQKVRVEVDSNWSDKKYRDLNDSITDLRMMEDKFKACPDVFSSSWNSGIVEKVESEIEVLGGKARGYIRSEKKAKQNLDDFRRCFLNMGHVLVELPTFKDHTKSVMSGVLESCLSFNWGYSFLFEFGLGLQKGDESFSVEDNHVAAMIVAEFSHFKEVMTMVWNEGTSQKPAEVTVNDITALRRRGGNQNPLEVRKSQLLDSFRIFESQYKKLLAEFIAPDADLKALVQKTVSYSNKLLPLNCDYGWTEKVKQQIPHILAGVFTVFTVLKSGASYNRLTSSDSGCRSEKLLMKPHNIQVLTILTIFGCGSTSSSSLESQLMQIRTGEGKSMILGAAATVLGLLGFRARCVCYSECLSRRDFALFQDVFDCFSVTEYIKYSKITTLSEDSTAAKGDIRQMTELLIRGKLGETATSYETLNGPTKSTAVSSNRKTGKTSRRKRKSKAQTAVSTLSDSAPMDRKEILLVDEVDVFFGSEVYGKTYNQVTQVREKEVVDILNHIWIADKHDGRKQRLVDIQALPAYSRLLNKFDGFKYLIDTEISLMIDQVRRLDEEPYYLDTHTDRIGYKVMDTVSFEATYGYRTVFAYLQEAENGNLQQRDSTLAHVLSMPISCGQFSYANISPERILGVSGTLSALGEYENEILSKYGVETFVYVPSVYGDSNFQFDKAGEGIRIEANQSDYFHSITDQVQLMTRDKRSAIVFFKDTSDLKRFTSSQFYSKLGRQKKLLTEDMDASDKAFVISKAATAGQVTISTAVFGRGTDFFCKDDLLQKNGGVHVIQTFLSEELSEEIQIQGRTARQGKKGSYQMILLETDLEGNFGLSMGEKEKVAKAEWYDWLCKARDKRHKERCIDIEKDLVDATEKDHDTHRYFDALLANEKDKASSRFKEIYTSFKKGSMPSSIDLDIAILMDVTGSMDPYAKAAASAMNSLLVGSSSIVQKLKSTFPEIEFRPRVGVMAYRDIEDGARQFSENTWHGASHFTDNIKDAVRFLEVEACKNSGGFDIAEDHLSAITRSANWTLPGDWTSSIKCMLLLTDAPAHCMVPSGSAQVANVDSYSVRHPNGLTVESVADLLMKNGVDLFICSFNPAATSPMEQMLSKAYADHKDNTEQRDIISVPMVATNNIQNTAQVLGGHGKHMVFVLDMSGSMRNDWSGVVAAYNRYIVRRRQNQSDCDIISIVQFNDCATVEANMMPISKAPNQLSYRGGGTSFHPAAQSACGLASATPQSHSPTVVFMSDGRASDAGEAAGAFSQLNREIRNRFENDLDLHVIAFGSGASTAQLQQIAEASRNGKLHSSADTAELSNIFVEIAGGSSVAEVLEAEIGKRISEAVSDRLSVEYFA